jgi:hypothetical protein
MPGNAGDQYLVLGRQIEVNRRQGPQGVLLAIFNIRKTYRHDCAEEGDPALGQGKNGP